MITALLFICRAVADETPTPPEAENNKPDITIVEVIETKEFLDRQGHDFKRLTTEEVIQIAKTDEPESFEELINRMTLVKQNAAEGNGLKFAVAIINSLQVDDDPAAISTAWTTALTCLWTPIDLEKVEAEEALSKFITETKDTWIRLLAVTNVTMKGVGNSDRFTVSDYAAWALANLRMGASGSRYLHDVRDAIGAEFCPWLQVSAKKILNGESVGKIPSIHGVANERSKQIKNDVIALDSNDLWKFRSGLSISEKLAFHKIISDLEEPTPALLEMCRTIRHIKIDDNFPADLTFIKTGMVLTPDIIRELEQAMLLHADCGQRYLLELDLSQSGAGVTLEASVLDKEGSFKQKWLKREQGESGEAFFALRLQAIKVNSRDSVIQNVRTAGDNESFKQTEQYIRYQSAIEKVFNPSLVGGGLVMEFYIRGEDAPSVGKK